ncbi:gem-associated protein 8 [Protopterus annectens]|uniref:gem-associated protein 8 n=1 Tax=Protopterus annectens TaxID=7888 RepID=UPI001CFC11C9|nr:gem-associated protein 8 [Protopterus annectens]
MIGQQRHEVCVFHASVTPKHLRRIAYIQRDSTKSWAPLASCIWKTMQQKEDEHLANKSPWYAHKIYSKYWRHYSQAMQWLDRHKQAYKKAVESTYCYPGFESSGAASNRDADWDVHESLLSSSSNSSEPNQRRHHYQGMQHPKTSEKSTEKQVEMKETGGSEDSESEYEIECDISNMEITEELRQYFAQTEKHREELKRQHQISAQVLETYVAADHDLHLVKGRTVEPPAERPGERRVAEMKLLYGEDASKIQGMETAMQLTFDRNCDKKQPKYWPIIPLRL